MRQWTTVTPQVQNTQSVSRRAREAIRSSRRTALRSGRRSTPGRMTRPWRSHRRRSTWLRRTPSASSRATLTESSPRTPIRLRRIAGLRWRPPSVEPPRRKRRRPVPMRISGKLPIRSCSPIPRKVQVPPRRFSTRSAAANGRRLNRSILNSMKSKRILQVAPGTPGRRLVKRMERTPTSFAPKWRLEAAHRNGPSQFPGRSTSRLRPVSAFPELPKTDLLRAQGAMISGSLLPTRTA